MALDKPITQSAVSKKKKQTENVEWEEGEGTKETNLPSNPAIH